MINWPKLIRALTNQPEPDKGDLIVTTKYTLDQIIEILRTNVPDAVIRLNK